MHCQSLWAFIYTVFRLERPGGLVIFLGKKLAKRFHVERSCRRGKIRPPSPPASPSRELFPKLCSAAGRARGPLSGQAACSFLLLFLSTSPGLPTGCLGRGLARPAPAVHSGATASPPHPVPPPELQAVATLRDKKSASQESPQLQRQVPQSRARCLTGWSAPTSAAPGSPRQRRAPGRWTEATRAPAQPY